MIISCSRRTDIPAFYSRWFINRIREGFCLVPNPYNSKLISRVDLSPKAVDLIVFWSKNPAPLIEHLAELDARGYKYYFLYTLNDYPPEFEPGVPPLEARLETFKNLAGRIGPQKVVWRYDPIIFSTITPPKFHREKFEKLSRELEGSTKRCIISLVDIYGKTGRAFKNLADEKNIEIALEPEKSENLPPLLSKIGEIAQDRGLEIYSCAEARSWKNYGIKWGKCIDDNFIYETFGIKVGGEKDKYQRELCGCVKSKDIGSNNTCPHNCIYCYSAGSRKAAINNFNRHDPNEAVLIPLEEILPRGGHNV